MAAKSNRIVGKYARMWPREMFDHGGKIAKDLDFLKLSGVYVLYNNEHPHYIGQATSLLDRLTAHARPQSKYYSFWNLFSAFAVSDPEGRNELEAILIAAMPTANSAKPKLDKMLLPPKVIKLMKKIRDSKIS